MTRIEIEGAPSIDEPLTGASAGFDDPRVIEALEEYLAAREAGLPSDPEAFLARHASVADALRPALEGVDLLVGSSSSGTGSSSSKRGSASSPSWFDSGDDSELRTDLDDYQVIREVGRGGMGVVYEAVQRSLGRRVALKVLPPTATLDRRRRTRFQHEAQTAAQLQHPHIVPVYSVGNERGIPFYTMRFIDGPSLGNVIGHLRRDEVDTTPDSGSDTEPEAAIPEPMDPFPYDHLMGEEAAAGPRSAGYQHWVARLGVQACEALEHAHAQGVVHRDIKPANLLLDRRGELWITDFGLARLRGDVQVTLTGDLVGTIRYMSPEQALGRHAVLDGRTDVYSLGATLYELLTLRPVFEGRDAADLLKRIAEQDPTSPRRLNPSLPRPLETVVLKAMAKDPAARYASARELGDDLGRFLRDEPVHARPPAVWERAMSWSRRHRAAFNAALCVVVLALLGLIVGTWSVWKEMLRTQEALALESVQRRRAEANVELAMQALDEVYLQVVERASHQGEGRAQENSELLRRALDFYDRFVQQNVQTPNVHRLSAEAYARAGDIHSELGEVVPAERSYRRSIAILEDLIPRYPKIMRYRVDLSVCWNNLGVLLRDTNREQESEQVFRKALDLLRTLDTHYPFAFECRRRIAMLEHNLGVVLMSSRRPQEASRYLESALATRLQLIERNPDLDELQNDLALTHMSLGGLQRSRAVLDEAESSFRQAVLRLDELVVRDPLRLEYRRNLGRSLYNRSLILSETRRLGEAEPIARRALDIQRELADRHPNLPEIQDDMALTSCCLAHIQAALGQHDDAELSFRQALTTWERLARSNPSIPAFSTRLCRIHVELAWLLRDQDKTDAAIDHFHAALAADSTQDMIRNDLAWLLITRRGHDSLATREALDLSRLAVEHYPKVPAFWNTYGVVLYRTGRLEEASNAFAESMKRAQGGDGFDWFYLALLAHRRNDLDAAAEWFDRADRWLAEQAHVDQETAALRDEVATRLLRPSLDEGQADSVSTQMGPIGTVVARSSRPSGPATTPTAPPVCRSGLGIGPTSITNHTLQRSHFPSSVGTWGAT